VNVALATTFVASAIYGIVQANRCQAAKVTAQAPSWSPSCGPHPAPRRRRCPARRQSPRPRPRQKRCHRAGADAPPPG
jgi:hypothetical protein